MAQSQSRTASQGGMATVSPIRQTATDHGPHMLILGLIIIVALILTFGRKHEEVWDNALVDLVVVTVGVFAIAAVGRYAGSKAGVPGLSAFFGGKTA